MTVDAQIGIQKDVRLDLSVPQTLEAESASTCGNAVPRNSIPEPEFLSGALSCFQVRDDALHCSRSCN